MWLSDTILILVGIIFIGIIISICILALDTRMSKNDPMLDVYNTHNVNDDKDAQK
jgi:hypothetical protein